MMMKEESVGITKQQRSFTVDEHLEEFSALGYSVIEGVLNETELAGIRKRLDAVYDIQVKESGQNNFKLEDIQEQNVARMPFAYDPYFMKLLTLPATIDYVKRIMGNYFILHLQNGIINKPGEKHHQGSWHRDLPHQEFVISKPLAVNTLFCIDEFSEKTGATWVLPSSHKTENIPPAAYIEKYSIPLIAPAGSVILMDSMVFHRAGFNSSSVTRRAINQVYGSGILKQQINIPAMLNGKYADDPFMSMLLGYESSETASVIEYRLKRMKKMKK